MSFVDKQLDMPNSNKSSGRPLRLCGKCDNERVPEGGIDMGHRWICAVCWTRRQFTNTVKSVNDKRRS
jgi:hypothetical protein